MKPNVIEVIFFLAIVSALLANFPDPIKDLERDRQEYCEMVRIHRADPSLGWPDYKNIYKEVCEDDISYSAPK